MGWGTAIGEALKIVADFILDPKRKAKSAEQKKQDAFDEAEKLAGGSDEKKMDDYISNLPR